MRRAGPVLLVALGLPACSDGSAPGGAPELGSVVGRVAGETVTLAEVDTRAHGVVTRLLGRIEAAQQATRARLAAERLAAREAAGEPVPEAWRDAGRIALPEEEVDAALRESGLTADDPTARTLVRALLHHERLRVARRRVAADLAERGLVAVSGAEIEQAARLVLFQQRGRIVAEARRRFEVIADEILLRREAARRGSDPAALLALVEAGAAPVAEEEVRRFAAQRGAPDAVPEGVRALLEMRARLRAREDLLATLRARTPPVFLLASPEPPRFPMDVQRAADAAGVALLVVFSNWRCQRCEDTERVLDALVAGPLGASVRLVRRPFSLAPDPAFFADAVAWRCVVEQGREVAFHAGLRELLGGRGRSRRLDAPVERVSDSDALAGVRLGRTLVPDTRGYDACLASAATHGRVLGERDEGERIGFARVPAFLVNGLPLVGFQGRERLEAVLRSEAAAH